MKERARLPRTDNWWQQMLEMLGEAAVAKKTDLLDIV